MAVAPAGYKAVKAAVLDRILRREWPPGALIPTEAALAREYGCARATANRALRELAATGFVERRRKAGTRVAERRLPGGRLMVPVVRLEVEASGRAYGYRLLERAAERADAALAAALGVAAGAALLRLRCLHLADGAPHQLESRWINLAAAPAAATEPFTALSPNEWLVREVPYTESEHRFGAAAATAEEAAALGLAPGAALFCVERRTWLGGDPVTLARLLHPAGYRLVCRDDWGR